MTALTVVLEQGQNVFIESGSWFFGCGEGGSCNQNRRGEESHARRETRTSIVYKNEIVILSGVAASPREAAAQSKDPYPRQHTFAAGISGNLSRQLLRQDRGTSTHSDSQANARLRSG